MKDHFVKRSNNIGVFTDHYIISVLEENLSDEKEDAVLKFLYESVSKSLHPFVISNNGSQDDADDVLQDAIIVFYENVKAKKYRLQTTVSGYIYTVGKYIWFNKLRKDKKKSTLEEVSIEHLEIEESISELFQTDVSLYTKSLLEAININCKNILVDSIYKKMDMKQIALKYDLKNEQVARNKKYKCLKRMRSIIENSPYFSAILEEIEL